MDIRFGKRKEYDTRYKRNRMREIKFRAWNIFEEEFVDSDEYAVTFNGIIFKANLAFLIAFL